MERFGVDSGRVQAPMLNRWRVNDCGAAAALGARQKLAVDNAPQPPRSSFCGRPLVHWLAMCAISCRLRRQRCLDGRGGCSCLRAKLGAIVDDVLADTEAFCREKEHATARQSGCRGRRRAERTPPTPPAPCCSRRLSCSVCTSAQECHGRALPPVGADAALHRRLSPCGTACAPARPLVGVADASGGWAARRSCSSIPCTRQTATAQPNYTYSRNFDGSPMRRVSGDAHRSPRCMQ